MGETLGFLLVLGWLACPIAGLLAAADRNAAGPGLLAGLLLGPLGVIAALGFDARPCCPRCGGRLNAGLSRRPPWLCQHCRAPLRWKRGVPGLALPQRPAAEGNRELPVKRRPIKRYLSHSRMRKNQKKAKSETAPSGLTVRRSIRYPLARRLRRVRERHLFSRTSLVSGHPPLLV